MGTSIKDGTMNPRSGARQICRKANLHGKPPTGRGTRMCRVSPVRSATILKPRFVQGFFMPKRNLSRDGTMNPRSGVRQICRKANLHGEAAQRARHTDVPSEPEKKIQNKKSMKLKQPHIKKCRN